MSPEEEMVINRNIMKLQEHLYKALKQRDQHKVERDKLEAQKIAFARSYKQVVEENKKLKQEIKRLKGED